MTSKTFNRYIWLLNTLLQYKRMTFDEISSKWAKSCIGDGKPLALRTFHVHRDAIAELFGVDIECDLSNYEYYISTPDILKTDKIRQWLLNSFTVSNMITAGHNMKDRILFEDIPAGTEYIQTIVEAMQLNKELEIEYKPFGHTPSTHVFQPYAMKVYNQRWYILGCFKDRKNIRSISLDRISSIQIMSESFQLPDNFDAEEYYSNTIGIFADDQLKPEKVILRVYGINVDYIRTLPIHHTQKEINTSPDNFSDFQYILCLTPELTTKILSMGENVEVLEPQQLRVNIKRLLVETLDLYNKQY